MNEIKWNRKTKDFARQQELKLRVLLDIAAHEFTTRGYLKTSLDDLADSMKITKPALYYYVKNKEDILLKCTMISLELVEQCLEETNRGGGTGIERLRRFFQQYAELVVGDYGSALIREARRNLKGKNQQKLRKMLRAGQELFEQIVRDGIADGTIRECSPKFVGYLIFSTLNQMPVWYNPEGVARPSQLADELLDIAVTGLAPR